MGSTHTNLNIDRKDYLLNDFILKFLKEREGERGGEVRDRVKETIQNHIEQ